MLDEGRWQYFAQAAAAHGIRSSLSFPIRDVDDVVVGGMHLYASEPDAFADQRFFEVGFGADLAEVATNARRGWTRERARAQLERAGELAGVPKETVADIVMSMEGAVRPASTPRLPCLRMASSCPTSVDAPAAGVTEPLRKVVEAIR